MTDPRLVSLLHFADSAFPTGGYAHSFGLEHYCQAGIVRDRDGLERFLLTQLEGAAGPCDATAAAGALRALGRGDLEACRRLDEALEAMKVVKEFREGSRQMGRQTLRVAAALIGDPRLAAYFDEVNAHRAAGGRCPPAPAHGPARRAGGAVEPSPRDRARGARGGRAAARRALELHARSGHPGHAPRAPRRPPVPLMTGLPRPLKIGIGGPVGSGKTALVETLSLRLRDHFDMAVITNDIYTQEDAQFLIRRGALPAERVVGVETGGCPHTAIREDASVNLEAVHGLMGRFPGLELLFVESGGDNLAATFSPELVDATIYVIDVAQGEKIPRKGGPGIMRSDLLVINKIDLAPHVGADLGVMERDAKRMRGERPFVFTNLREGTGVDAVVSWIRRDLLFEP